MEKIVLKSGSILNFQLAPIQSSFKLFQKVVQEFKKNGVEIKIDRDTPLDLLSIFEKNPSGFISGFLDIVSSDIALEVILECALRCSYESNGNKEKINLGVFEDEIKRGDFFEVMKTIAWKNLKPFFPNLLIK